MKVVVELELDMDAYKGKYGPGTEWWKNYRYDRVPDGGQNKFGPTYHKVPKPASEYEFATEKAQHVIRAFVEDVLREGFYDWAEEGWLKMKVGGVVARQCCKTFEDEAHKDYCGQ